MESHEVPRSYIRSYGPYGSANLPIGYNLFLQPLTGYRVLKDIVSALGVRWVNGSEEAYKYVRALE